MFYEDSYSFFLLIYSACNIEDNVKRYHQTVLAQIPVLKQLRDLEREAGKDVRLKRQETDDEDPLENAGRFQPRRYRPFRGGGGYRGRGRPFRFVKEFSQTWLHLVFF